MNTVQEILAALNAGKFITLEFSCRADANGLRQRLAIAKHRQEIPYQKLGMDVAKLVLRQRIDVEDEATGTVQATYFMQSREEFQKELAANTKKPAFTILAVGELHE